MSETIEQAIIMVKFTPRAEAAITLARKEADKQNNLDADIGHVALALVKLGDGAHSQVWKRLGFDVEGFEHQLRRSERSQRNSRRDLAEGFGLGIQSRYSPSVSELLETAEKEAKALNHSWVGTEHILLAFLNKNILSILSPLEQEVVKAFGDFGLQHEQVRDAILAMYGPDNIPGQYPRLELASQDLGFRVFVDPGSATPEEIAEVFEAVSELNRAVGGHGMLFLDCAERSETIAGVQC